MEQRWRKKGLALEFQRKQLVDRHRDVRQGLRSTQSERWQDEERNRAARLPRGFKGLWSWITGGLKKIRLQNALEVAKSDLRDRSERQELIATQLVERRALQVQVKAQRASQQRELAALHRDMAHYMLLGGKAPEAITKAQSRAGHDRSRPHDHDDPQGPDIER